MDWLNGWMQVKRRLEATLKEQTGSIQLVRTLISANTA